jgi:hypothetical protein
VAFLRPAVASVALGLFMERELSEQIEPWYPGRSERSGRALTASLNTVSKAQFHGNKVPLPEPPVRCSEFHRARISIENKKSPSKKGEDQDLRRIRICCKRELNLLRFD